jgi:hypothetical protein
MNLANLQLTPEELLAGASLTYAVAIPRQVLQPGQPPSPEGTEPERVVQLKPLTIGIFQLIMKAAQNEAGLIPLLMIKESMVDPSLALEQIKGLPLGLVTFLIEQIRQISGLTEKKSLSPG